jgi:hypothetical protein
LEKGIWPLRLDPNALRVAECEVPVFEEFRKGIVNKGAFRWTAAALGHLRPLFLLLSENTCFRVCLIELTSDLLGDANALGKCRVVSGGCHESCLGF